MWYVYLLRCADATLYCGVTTDMGAAVEGAQRGKPWREVYAGAPSR